MQFSERQQAILELLRSPFEAVARSFGIEVRKARTGYVNMSRCPWCGHGNEGRPNYQCGVKDSPARRLGFLHHVKCLHPHDAPTNLDSPPYATFLAALGAITPEEAQWALNLRAELDREHLNVKVFNSSSGLSPLHDAFNRRLAKRLKESRPAMDWLTKVRGYDLSVTEFFRLGLSEPYRRKGTDEVVHSDVLVAPLLGRDGRFFGKYVYYLVPGVSLDNRAERPKAWSAGEPRVYYGGKVTAEHTSIFICDGLKDLWAIWSALKGTDLIKHLALATSTNGGGIHPKEWQQPGYWDAWDRVYLGHDSDRPHPRTGLAAGDEHAKALARRAARQTHRVWPLGHKDWNDYFLSGKVAADFKTLLEQASALDTRALEEPSKDGDLGFAVANAEFASGTYRDGFLYYPVRVLNREIDRDSGQKVERYENLVIRSDRTSHRAAVIPAPKGTPAEECVMRLLPDGMLLRERPRAAPYATWRWPAINAYLSGTTKPRPLAQMLEAVHLHLRARAWLPFEEDFMLLACTVVASYAQAIFDAVPLIMITGAKGSGKSALTEAVSELAMNCPPPVGQVSPATIARLINDTSGAMALDDLEKIAAKSTGDSQFHDLVQCLKLSYKKATANKHWTNMKTGKIETLGFYGIKFINNTLGADEILGSRMLRVQTYVMPESVRLPDGALSPHERGNLRDSLHVWVMSNVDRIAQAYSAIFPNPSIRAEEIAAPLRVIAVLSESQRVQNDLEVALNRQGADSIPTVSTSEILREALIEIVQLDARQRQLVRTHMTVTEAKMRMAIMAEKNFGKNYLNEVSNIENPEWIGRQLNQLYAEPGSEPIRFRLNDSYLRGVELSQKFVKKAVAAGGVDAASLVPSSDPKAFCGACNSCDYQTVCEMRFKRQRT